MMGTEIVGGGYTPPPTYTNANELLDGLARFTSQQTQKMTEADVVSMLAALGKLAGAGGTQGTGGIAGVSNGNGAPAIDGVHLDFSAEDMALALQALQGKTQEGQLKVAKEGVQMSQNKVAQKHAESLKKIDEMITKQKEADEKGKTSGIFGWITKIAAVVASVVAVAIAAAATIATAGAAAPLLALAVIGLVGATMSLASAISQEYGGPPLDLGHWMNKGMTALLESPMFGMKPPESTHAGKMLAGAVGILTGAVLVDPSLAGSLAGGIAGLSGGDEMAIALAEGITSAVVGLAISITMVVLTGGAAAPAAMSGLAKTINMAAKITQGVVGITAGVAGAAAGGLNMAKASDEFDVAKLGSSKSKIDALIMKLAKQMEEDREQVKKVLDEIMQGMSIVSQIINSGAQSRSQLAANIGTGRAQTI
jgi:hypothetical protein